MIKYQIAYQNGITQSKNLVSREQYQNTIKPLQEAIGFLEQNKKTEYRAKQLKSILKGLYGSEWFVEGSPLFDAIKTGKLVLPPQQGGTTKCKIKKK